MFAILISSANREKIEQDSSFDPSYLSIDLTLASKTLWYYVTGYVTKTGKFYTWSTLPAYVLERDFEYDTDKIQTDWDQIVRKD